MERKAGDYGGKLFTIVNCTKTKCVAESSWARPINEEYEKLIDMDWADKSDNFILRITGLGAVIMMVFELIFILTMLYIQYFTPYGVTSSMSFFFIPGDAIIVMGLVVVGMNVIGNLLGAILLQTSLQVYVHERQLGTGIALMLLIIIEAVFLLFRGVFFDLSAYPNSLIVNVLFSAFLFATILISVGALMAISNGMKKRKQLKEAREKLGLSL
jgi:fatty acid desaturase